MTEENKTWTPEEVAAQLRKPAGSGGEVVAGNMQTANKNLYDMVFAEIPANGNLSVLEIGFGNGAHFDRYFQHNPAIQLTGLDFSEDMCKLARELNQTRINDGKLSIHFGDVESTPFANNSFDLVIGINTIYFWDPPQKYLGEILRILKPGGKFITGYRPRTTMDQLEFTQFGFKKYEPDEYEIILKQSGFLDIRQSKQEYERIPVFGEKVSNTDIVAVASKPF